MKRLVHLLILFSGLLFGGYFLASPTTRAAGALRQQPKAARPQSAAPLDPVARLQRRIERGEVKLEYREQGGWLHSVLKELQVPASSQSLVFSRTSLQSLYISPANPRAIYFNDSVYVGFIRGAELLEISVVDPVLGANFYFLEQKPTARPVFTPNESCMRCHGSANTRFVPGHFVRSISIEGAVEGATSFITDHASPFSERWGGWYVTGTHSEARHQGSPLVIKGQPSDKTGIDLTGYASRHSDIVAMMVLAHQTQMQNLIAWAAHETRVALHEQADLDKVAGKPAGKLAFSTDHRIEYAVGELLKSLLFTDEARLHGPVVGMSGFAEEFASQGVKDKKGRSLREFDLKQRLFRYPCSYLIYSEAFDNIPQPALDRLYRRLWQVLTWRTKEPAFATLSEADRAAILEILRETKKGLPSYFFTN